MRATQNVHFDNIAADTAAFTLAGGLYMVDAKATWGGGNIVLERLGPDGVTWIPLHTALSADGTAGPIYCPPGQYRINITTSTGIYVNISRVPQD